MGWVIAVPAGLVLGGVATLSHHLGLAGTGGRPFVIFLLVCLVAVFVLDEWSDGAR
jgi:hypothetical protein